MSLLALGRCLNHCSSAPWQPLRVPSPGATLTRWPCHPQPRPRPLPGSPLSSGSKLAKCAKGGFGAEFHLDFAVCDPSPFRDAASRISFSFNPISTARNLRRRWPRGCQEVPAPVRLQPRLAAVFAGGGGVFALRRHLCEGRSRSGLRSELHGARGIPAPCGAHKPRVGLLAGGSRVSRAPPRDGNGVGRGHHVPHLIAPMCPLLRGEERLRVRPASCSASCFGLLGASRGRENFIISDKPFFPHPGEVSGLAVTAEGGRRMLGRAQALFMRDE